MKRAGKHIQNMESTFRFTYQREEFVGIFSSTEEGQPFFPNWLPTGRRTFSTMCNAFCAKISIPIWLVPDVTRFVDVGTDRHGDGDVFVRAEYKGQPLVDGHVYELDMLSLNLRARTDYVKIEAIWEDALSEAALMKQPDVSWEDTDSVGTRRFWKGGFSNRGIYPGDTSASVLPAWSRFLSSDRVWETAVHEGEPTRAKKDYV